MASQKRHVNGGPDWPEVLARLRRQGYLSQQCIAESCGVAPQTVSAWKNRRRTPGLYAARKLLELCRENRIPLEPTDYTATPDLAAKREREDGPPVPSLTAQEQHLLNCFRKTPAALRPGLLAFAKFVTARQ